MNPVVLVIVLSTIGGVAIGWLLAILSEHVTERRRARRFATPSASCAEVLDIDSQLPLRCSEPKGHRGDHRACGLSDECYAQWPRGSARSLRSREQEGRLGSIAGLVR